jgi:hypothetical protein
MRTRSSTRAWTASRRYGLGENTKNLEQYGEDAARSLVELVTVLQARGITYPLEAYRVFSYLTRTAGELRTAIELLGASVQGLHERDRLMTDYRGEPLDEVIEVFTELCGRSMDLAGGLNGTLSKAHSAVGHLAYKRRHLKSRSRSRRNAAETVCSSVSGGRGRWSRPRPVVRLSVAARRRALRPVNPVSRSHK